MKKMMIMLFAGLLAISAKAASATWSASGLTDYVGCIAYLYTDVTGIADAIEAGTFTGSDALATSTVTSAGRITKAQIGSFQNESVTFYTVLFDGATVADSENYKITEGVTKTFGQTGGQTFQFTSQLAAATFTPVPEPTAIALLLMGVAAVGLKRRA